ncbi:hypothetical protein [Roseiconus lacunae]|uniref:Uncharacterized protein n=1 Tax=Roseiconus lacunae TaxID=2605694 RepID=A0ABT7PEL8_9BACT|nr:hypothetical protein [Roseiconus lacunae]MDM4014932.1 hypothetical protein [Roseiconus lacunae]
MNLGQRLLAKSLSAKRSRRGAIEEALAKGQCIFPNCECELDRRGLCKTHANEFYGELRRLPDDEARAEREMDLIVAGLVLPAYGQRTQRRASSFDQAMKAG